MHEIGIVFLGTLPIAIGVVFVWLQNRQQFAAVDKQFTAIDQKFEDLNAQVRHFVDLHIGHEGRVSTLEERTKNL